MNYWQILGIEPTTDIKEIKRAYSRLAAEVHPEEYPEEFQELHAAYQEALKSAKRAKQYEAEYQETNVESTSEPEAETEEISEQHGEFLRHLYFEYEDDALIQPTVLAAMEKIEAAYQKRVSRQLWFNIFVEPPVVIVCDEPSFVDALLKYLKANKPQMNMINALFDAYKLYKYDGVENSVYSELYKFVFDCRVKYNSVDPEEYYYDNYRKDKKKKPSLIARFKNRVPFRLLSKKEKLRRIVIVISSVGFILSFCVLLFAAALANGNEAFDYFFALVVFAFAFYGTFGGLYRLTNRINKKLLRGIIKTVIILVTAWFSLFVVVMYTYAYDKLAGAIVFLVYIAVLIIWVIYRIVKLFIIKKKKSEQKNSRG